MAYLLARRITAFICLLTLVVSVVGCRSESATNGTSKPRRIILLTNGDDPFWDAMRKGMEKAEQDLKLADANLKAFLDKGDFSEEAQINKLNQYATQSDIAAVAISSVDEGTPRQRSSCHHDRFRHAR